MSYPPEEHVLCFDYRRGKDGFRITDATGTLVATIASSFWRAHFQVTDHEGRPMLRGKARWHSGWTAADPEGRTVATIWGGLIHRYRLALREGKLQTKIEGLVYSRSWRVETADGKWLVMAVPRPDFVEEDAPQQVWAVRGDGTLSTCEIIAIVECHRQDLRHRRRRRPRERLPTYTPRG